MTRVSGITMETDTAEFEQYFETFDKELGRQLRGVAEYLATTAEINAREIIQREIYDTDPRYYYETPDAPYKVMYDRTGELKRAIQGDWAVAGDFMEVYLNAETSYARENELGRGESYVALDEILRDARAMDNPLSMGRYPRQRPGEQEHLEPRPFILPAIAQAERDLPDLVFMLLESLQND